MSRLDEKRGSEPFGIRRLAAPRDVRSLLPRVPADMLGAINRLSRPRGAIRLTVLGAPVTLRVTTLDLPGDTALTLALSIGGDDARLGLSLPLLERLLGQLGGDVAVLDERPAQRAVLFEYALLGLLAPVEQRLGRRVSVLPAELPAHAGLPLSLGLVLTFDDGAPSTCRLDLTAGLAAHLAAELDRLAPPEPLDLAAVPTMLAVSAGSQTLEAAEIQGLLPGDVVMLDAAIVTAVVGDRLHARLDAVGDRFRLKSALAPLPLQKDPFMSDNEEEGGIASLPVRLVFEFGRAEMSIGDLRALAPGSLLPLSRPVDDAVDIVANGRRIGRGSLVTIGDAIGVRITRLADDSRPSADE